MKKNSSFSWVLFGCSLTAIAVGSMAFPIDSRLAIAQSEMRDSDRGSHVLDRIRTLQASGRYYQACRQLLRHLNAAELDCLELVRRDAKSDLQTLFGELAEASIETDDRLWKSLADTLRQLGALNVSKTILDRLDDLGNLDSEFRGELAISLGNVNRDLSDRYREFGDSETAQSYEDDAIEFYEKAMEIPTNEIRLRSRLHLLRFLVDRDPENSQISALSQTIAGELSTRSKNTNVSEREVYQQIDFSRSLACLYLRQNQLELPSVYVSPLAVRCAKTEIELDNFEIDLQNIAEILNSAVSQAKELGDARLESYALGFLGELYEMNGQWQYAKELTEKALGIAQSQSDWDMAYQWQWQLGRLYMKGDDRDLETTIALYETAVQSLENVRKNLLVSNTDVRFSFRDNIEPLYRQLVRLLLLETSGVPSQENLQKSLYYIDSLQLVELANFLGCNPLANRQGNENRDDRDPVANLTNKLDELTQANPELAFFYTIAFPDRVAVIVKVAHRDELLYHVEAVNGDLLQQTLDDFDIDQKDSSLGNDTETFQTVYRWTIAPFATEIEAARTLTFILDAPFRKLSVAALHDGEQYIIQKKAVAVTPSLQLFEVQSFNIHGARVLVAGSHQSRKGFDDLSGVQSQIDRVRDNLRDVSTLNILSALDGSTFTKESFRDRLFQYSYDVVHVITHGQFSSNPKQTFIFTDDASDDYTLSLDELESLLQVRVRGDRDPIDLLVLSACETASGDDRAVLGLAGVAVKSGAIATIAPLWKVSQVQSNKIVDAFYHNLSAGNVSKAEALQLAQKNFIEQATPNNRVPRHWAAFTLVGY